jgi:hypothetical protein
MNIEQAAIKILELELRGHNYYGLRAIQPEHNKASIGDELEPSNDWDTENDCSSSKKLSGTCCIEIDPDDYDDIEYSLGLVSKYSGDQIVVIAGFSCEHGNDDGEIIIAGAVVVAEVDEGGK